MKYASRKSTSRSYRHQCRLCDESFVPRERDESRTKAFASNDSYKASTMSNIVAIACACLTLSLLLWIVTFVRINDGQRYSFVRTRDRSNLDVLRDATRPSISTRAIRESSDCSIANVYCAFDDDCDALCVNYENATNTCNDNRCVVTSIERDANERNDNENDNDDNDDQRCDVERGEFALLEGHTGLGVANWKCVQIYKKFADRDQYCEGGTFMPNVKLREPSYNDCECPKNTVRAVYNLAASASMDDVLPHCVSIDHWRFYANSMRPV